MENIYDELDNYERVGENNELKEENERLRSCVKELEEKISQLSKCTLQENENVLKKLNYIENSFASLLKTAREEIQRKNEMIQNLNTEKDQLIFRHIGNRNRPFQQSRVREEKLEENDNRGIKRKRDNDEVKYRIPKLKNSFDKQGKTEKLSQQPNKGNESDRRNRTRTEFSPCEFEENENRAAGVHSQDRIHNEAPELHKENTASYSDNNESHRNISSKEKKDDKKTEYSKKESRDYPDKNHREIPASQKYSDKYDSQHRKKEKSRESEDRSRDDVRYSRRRSDRFSQNPREEVRPRYSKSKGRTEFRLFDRYTHSPSPDLRSTSSRESRTRYKKSMKIADRSPSKGKKIQSPSREKCFKKNTEKDLKSKRKTTVKSSSKDCESNGSVSHNDKHRKEEESNYLEEMEEEYKKHPDVINEGQLDEETKDHYHNDSLLQKRISGNISQTVIEKETIVEKIIMETSADVQQFLSPDHPDSGCSAVPVHCVNIEDRGSLTPMDDPRLYNENYFDRENIVLNKQCRSLNYFELDRTITLNLRSKCCDVDLKLPNFESKPASTKDLCDDDIKKLYMDVDEEIGNTSMESGELNDSFCEEDILFSKTAVETKRDVHPEIVNEKKAEHQDSNVGSIITKNDKTNEDLITVQDLMQINSQLENTCKSVPCKETLKNNSEISKKTIDDLDISESCPASYVNTESKSLYVKSKDEFSQLNNFTNVKACQSTVISCDVQADVSLESNISRENKSEDIRNVKPETIKLNENFNENNTIMKANILPKELQINEEANNFSLNDVPKEKTNLQKTSSKRKKSCTISVKQDDIALDKSQDDTSIAKLSTSNENSNAIESEIENANSTSQLSHESFSESKDNIDVTKEKPSTNTSPANQNGSCPRLIIVRRRRVIVSRE